MVGTIDNPWVGPPPREVPLTNPPLIRVIAQVRFGEILSIEGMVGPFQEAIRSDYPVLRVESAELTVASGAGAVENRTKKIWRFHDGSGHWRVSLTSGFLAIEATRYASRDDFVRRFEVLLARLEEHVRPQFAQRVGIRFIDRLVGAELADLPTLIRPEVAGPIGSSAAGPLRLSIHQAIFDLPAEGGQINARWGRLPVRTSIDPSAIDPIDEPSWILDLDAFVDGQQSLDVPRIATQVRALAEQIYRLFRWTVTDDFLRRFGGKPEAPNEAQPSARAIAQLRRLSGLTWDQLARLFGVSRRAVHFWASGMAMNVANETHLHRTLDVLVAADRGNARSNRTALLEATKGTSAFDLLVAQQWAEACQRLGPGSGRKTLSHRGHDEKSRAARQLPRPADLLDSREDTVHREIGRGRAAKKSAPR